MLRANESLRLFASRLEELWGWCGSQTPSGLVIVIVLMVMVMVAILLVRVMWSIRCVIVTIFIVVMILLGAMFV